MRKIIVTTPLEKNQKEWLETVPLHPEEWAFVYTKDADLTEDLIRDAEVIIGNPEPSILQFAENLKWLQLHSAGFDQYAKAGILPKDCLLTSAVGAYGMAVSEHMLAMTFSLIRHFRTYSLQQRKHIWKDTGNYISVEGSTVLVLGLGDIGGNYARKVKGCGAYVIGVRRSMKAKPEYVDEQYTIEDLDKVLPRADIVAMVVPGNAETENLMDERRLRLMKDESVLINVGRGNSLDLDALKKCLREGKFFGVGLDVFSPEPLNAEDELWDTERVLITPHTAGKFYIPETVRRIMKLAGENLYHYTRGEELKSVAMVFLQEK